MTRGEPEPRFAWFLLAASRWRGLQGGREVLPAGQIRPEAAVQVPADLACVRSHFVCRRFAPSVPVCSQGAGAEAKRQSEYEECLGRRTSFSALGAS